MTTKANERALLSVIRRGGGMPQKVHDEIASILGSVDLDDENDPVAEAYGYLCCAISALDRFETENEIWESWDVAPESALGAALAMVDPSWKRAFRTEMVLYQLRDVLASALVIRALRK